MRQLKFRIWDIKQCEFIESDGYLTKGEFFKDISLCWAIASPEHYHVTQYSPFFDHQETPVPICEGDILKYEYLKDKGCKADYMEVIFCVVDGAFESGKVGSDWQLLGEDLERKELFRITVVGNIFQNKELLRNGVYKQPATSNA